MRACKRLLLVGLVIGAVCLPPTVSADPLRSTRTHAVAQLTAQLDSVLEDPGLNGVLVGAVVRSTDTGEVLYDRDGDKRFPSASTAKIFTSTAALAELGDQYRFRTTVLSLEPPSGGIVSGDLYLHGTGDPTLLPSRFDELAADVAGAGVSEVRGSLVADDSWFDAMRLGIDWSQQDENFAYAAPISALSVSPDSDFNTGSVQVDMAPGPSVGAPAAVGLTPPTSVIHLDNHLTTGPPGSPRELAAERPHGTDRIVVSGNMPLDGRPAHPLRSVPDPTAYAADVFRTALGHHGVRVDGSTRTDTTRTGALEIAGIDSIPLRELLAPFLKMSNNPIAEILVKAMGRHAANDGSWQAGLRVVQGYIAARDVDPGNLQLVDGSGLSTSDLVTSKDLTAFMASIENDPWFDEWYAALPIAGEADPHVGGTLANRMADTPAADNLHAKTGSLATSSALAGYVTAAGGEHLVFAIFESGFVGDPPKDVEDALAVALAASDL